MTDRMPILVLAGSDVRPEAVPEGLEPEELLAGPKGTLPLPTGRCLAAELVTRIRASGCFAEPLLLGPRQWYESRVDCELVAVEGTLIQTLRQLMRTVQSRFPSGQPIAVTSCDILPTAGEFQQLMAKDYRPQAASCFWWQMIEARPDEMGASAWKPAYRLPLTSGGEPRNLYPGHLVVARAECLRFPLMNRLLELAYRYRNRVLERRYREITCGALGTLLAQDLRNLARFQAPLLTVAVPYVGLRGYLRYRRGTAVLGDVEQFLARAFLHRRCLHVAGGRPVVISVTTLQAFARDVDTRTELQELKAGLAPGSDK